MRIAVLKRLFWAGKVYACGSFVVQRHKAQRKSEESVCHRFGSETESSRRHRGDAARAVSVTRIPSPRKGEAGGDKQFV